MRVACNCASHSFFMNHLKIIFILFVVCICTNTYADDNINRRISVIYTTLSQNGSFRTKIMIF